MSTMHNKPHNKPDQQGFVSITVTLIIMAVLTLVVLGFAALMRREQRQALDRQLSTTAFYAAESGVNDAIDSLIKNPDQDDITSCQSPQPIAGYNNILDSQQLVKYTCVLTDSAPDSLEKSYIGGDKSSILPVDTKGRPIGSIKISWQATDAANLGQFSKEIAFPQRDHIASMIRTGILRVQTIPFRSGTLNRSSLINNSRTFFLYPLEGSGTPTTIGYGSSAAQGQVVSGNCKISTTPRECNVIINTLGTDSLIYLRLKSIYRPVAVSVRAYSAANGNGQQLELYNAQRLIDVTGKANDVLRRIQVRKPIETTYRYPEFAIESLDGICKRLVVWQGGAQADTSVSGDTRACAL